MIVGLRMSSGPSYPGSPTSSAFTNNPVGFLYHLARCNLRTQLLWTAVMDCDFSCESFVHYPRLTAFVNVHVHRIQDCTGSRGETVTGSVGELHTLVSGSRVVIPNRVLSN